MYRRRDSAAQTWKDTRFRIGLLKHSSKDWRSHALIMRSVRKNGRNATIGQFYYIGSATALCQRKGHDWKFHAAGHDTMDKNYKNLTMRKGEDYEICLRCWKIRRRR